MVQEAEGVHVHVLVPPQSWCNSCLQAVSPLEICSTAASNCRDRRGGGSLIRGTIWLAGWGQGGKGRGGTCGRPQGKGVADKWRGPLSRAPCSSHQHSCCCCCLVLRVCSPPPSTAAGVVPIIASWFISPLLAALICLAFFVVLRSLVLRRANSTRISFYVLPLLLVITVFINLFFILVRGAGGL